LRTTPKISITLEGNTWQDILREMTIIQECARRASSAPRIDDLPERANIAKDCQKCRNEHLGRLQWILGEYFLGPEERAEILERVR
jgi:hypothetical protein